jgi:hypothetical protein
MRRLALALWLLLLTSCAGHAYAQAQTQATAPINVSSATTTQIIAPNGTSRPTMVTVMHYVAGASDNLQWEWSLVPACPSGNTTYGGTENLATGGTVNLGSGFGAVLIVPPLAYLCLVTSTTAQVGGWLNYQQ